MFIKGNFIKAKPIWIKGYENEMNITAVFSTTVKKMNNLRLYVTGQNDYQIFINGQFVFFGPARAGHGFYRIDRISIDKYLTCENNEIKVLVSSYQCNNFYLINQKPFFCAELDSDGEIFNETGSDFWSATIHSNKIQRVERYSFQRPFCEVYLDKKPSPSLETYTLNIDSFIEREVSYPDFPYEKYARVIEKGYVKESKEAKKFTSWWWNKVGYEYSGFKNEELEFSTTSLVDKLILEKKDLPLDLDFKENQYALIEMRCNLTGFISAQVECKRDGYLIFTFDEILKDGVVDYSRLECVNAVVYRLKGGEKYNLLTEEPYTFKYINLISFGGEISVSDFGVVRTEFNKGEIIKKVKDSSDPQIKRIYEAATETFLQNTFDIYMDCPSRERAGWLCDSFFTSRVENFMSGKSKVEKSFLSNFVMNDQYELIPKGMIPMCYPADHTDGNFIPNWAMWYVLELKEYEKRTNDKKFILALKDRMYKLLSYFREFENENGLLSNLKGWIFVEWSECNNLCQDINYPTNMLYYKFKKTLCELYGDSSLEKEAESLRLNIRKESLTDIFFCDNALLCENGEQKLSGKITETCQYYAFFTGVATKEEDKALWDTMIKDFGSERKKTGKWKEVYFSNAFIGNYLRLELLMEAEEKEVLEKDIRGYFDYMARETGTLWENDTPGASCNHGFASHVLLWLDYLGYIENI